ncbi:MAG: PHP domain-containing protein [Nitrospira sp.]|nr:PHP domain-containing protein [Nitrospira sp.]MDE0405836.1 PHP domain-containing protein [Nitrospira sp.]MDE0486098.1 PHP domain-containing protein [Nitrospira sp.]
MARIDLHLHTRYSDGSLTPAEVVALAHHAGVTAMAITDHDIVDGVPHAMEAATPLGIEVIPGVELSSRLNEQELHVLGYFFDWQDSTFRDHLAQQRLSRNVRIPQIIERLNTLGLELSEEEVKVKAGSDSIGRPHVAQVLVDKGYVQDTREAFERYLKEGAPAYVSRMLSDTRDVIAWIRNAGGVPVLAHPTWTRCQGEPLYRLCACLKDAGLLGLEVFYSSHNRKQTSRFLELAKRLDLLVTGGSDFHGAANPTIHVGLGKGTLKIPATLLDPLRRAARS